MQIVFNGLMFQVILWSTLYINIDPKKIPVKT